MHNSIPFKIIECPPSLEVVAIHLLHSNSIVCVVYLSPFFNLTLFNDIISFLIDLSSSTKPVFIMGDFNLPDINWSTLSSSSMHSDLFCDFLYDCNLSQLVTAPTHCKGNCLDLILTNFPDSVSPISISSHHLIRSDHYMLSFTLPAKSHPTNIKQPTKYVPDLSKLDYGLLNQLLCQVDFSVCLLSTDVEFIWHCLREFIHNAIASLVPIVKLNPKNRIPKWYNSEIRHQINIVRSLWKKAKVLHTTTSLLLKLEAAEQCPLNKLVSSKQLYESQLINDFAFKNNSKIYKYISSIIKSDHLPTVMHLHSQSAFSDVDKVSLFNVFFESIYSKSDDNQPPADISPVDTLGLINITDLDVYTL